jgi:hypothetical protein
VKWIYAKGITLSVSTKIKTTFFADDQIIIADSQDNLQRGLCTLKNIVKDFGMDTSPGKSEMMVFLGQDPVRCKVIVENECLQQVKNFKYFSCEISYKNEKGIQQKLAAFAQNLGILNNTFKQILVQKFSHPFIRKQSSDP